MAFYKLNEENQIEESSIVVSAGYVLTEQSKDEYVYPLEGWIWAVDLAAAEAVLLQ